jgi:hypothetical protein
MLDLGETCSDNKHVSIIQLFYVDGRKLSFIISYTTTGCRDIIYFSSSLFSHHHHFMD